MANTAMVTTTTGFVTALSDGCRPLAQDVANASGGEGNFNCELNRRKRRKVTSKAKPSKAAPAGGHG